MHSSLRVASPPPKPLMIFDGDCQFCAGWIGCWRRWTAGAVDYLAAQDPSVAARFPEIAPERFAAAVHLIQPDGAVYAGAAAVFIALASRPGWQWPLRAYQRCRWFAAIAEWAYCFVANHRGFFSRLASISISQTAAR